jgi:RNA polymerase sigma factor (sigma-70 family)
MRTEDGYIIHKCLNGDTAAFGLLVDKYKASIYALAYSKLNNFHDAEDVTQETFIKAYQKLRTLRWWDSFLAWLYAIASNLCKQWIRSQSKRPDGEFAADQRPEVLNRPSMNSYRDEMIRESLRDALDSLPESYRQVLTLYYLGGMNSREIARLLGTSPNNIAQRLRRARAKLKTEMIAAMDETYSQQRLSADFTFRIVETLKRVKIQSLPRMPWFPWGLSAATGIILAVLSFTSSFNWLNPVRVGPAATGGLRVKLPSQSRGDIFNSEALLVTLELDAGSGGQPQSTKPSSKSPVDRKQGPTPQTLSGKAESAVVSDKQETVTISGRVVKDNAYIPNARVHVYARDNIRRESITQADGSFQVEIPEPRSREWTNLLLTAVAQYPQYSFGWTKLSKRNATNTVIRLYQPVAVTGVVKTIPGNAIYKQSNRIGSVSFPEFSNLLEAFLFRNPISFFAPKERSAPRYIPGVPRAVASGYARERRLEALATPRLLRYKGELALIRATEPVTGVEMPVYGFLPEVYMDEVSDHASINLSTASYSVDLEDTVPNWTARARAYIEVNEGQMVSSRGGLIADRVNADISMRDHCIGLHEIAQQALRLTALNRGSGERGGAFSHVDFRFQRKATLIMTVTDSNSSFQSELVSGSGRFRRYDRGRANIIGLAPGQKFSLKAERGELQVRGRTDAKEAQPDAEVEILMQRYKNTGISGHALNRSKKPAPSANVGLIMYLYAISDVKGL